MSMFDNLADQGKNLVQDHADDVKNVADQVGQLLGDNSGAGTDGVETDGAPPTDADADPFGDASGVTESDVDAAFVAE